MLMVLAALIGTQIVAANAAVVTFRQLFGGSNPDFARGIFVDSNYIYVVGETNSFGPNPPNLFLSIFRLDNSHKCSVAVDLGVIERGWKVVAYGGNVYVSGDTNYGGNPNVLVVKFDTNCNVLGAAVYDIDGADLPFGLTINPNGLYLYIAGRSTNGAHLLAVKTSDLSVAWARRFTVTGGDTTAHSVAFSGNKLYVTGRTIPPTPPTTLDLFVSKFDALTGNHETSKVFSTMRDEVGLDIVVAGGKVYVAGNYDDPVKQQEFLFMMLDTDLNNLELAKTFGTNLFDAVTSLSMVGGLAYAVGISNFFGSLDAALFAVDPSTGDLSHAFVLARDASVQDAQDSASTGSCLIYTGYSDGWPYYGVLDTVTAGTISFTITPTTPSIAMPSVTVTTPLPTLTAQSFMPTFDTPAMGDAYYSWFCPDALVVSTTTTSTVLTTSTLSTTVTSVVGTTTTVYDVRTTTITQTSVTTATSSTTTTLTQTATTTRTETTTLTQSTTYSTTYSTTTTLSTTLTYSTTTTLSTTTTSTQYFAEPVSTYVLPALLAVIAALLGASMVVGRRRRALPY